MSGAGNDFKETVSFSFPVPTETSRFDSAAVYCHDPFCPSAATNAIGNNVTPVGAPLSDGFSNKGLLSYISGPSVAPFNEKKCINQTKKYIKSYSQC